MSNRLLRHDLAILVSSFKAAFSTLRDRMLLLAASALVVVGGTQLLDVVHERVANLALYALAATAALVGALVQARVESRLSFLSAESVLAADALTPLQRAGYAALWHTATMTLLCVTALGLAWRSVATLLLAYALGVGLAWAAALLRGSARISPRPLRRAPSTRAAALTSGKHPLAQIVAAKQSFLGASLPAGLAAVSAAAALSVLMVAAAAAAGPESSALAVAAMLALAGLGLFSRVDPALVRFAAFAGVGAGRTVASHLPLTTAYSAAFALLALLLGRSLGSSVATIVLFLGAGAAGIVCLRILHYRLRPKRAADLAVQIEIAALAMLAFVFLPLAVLAGSLRLLLLTRSSRAATWSYQ